MIDIILLFLIGFLQDLLIVTIQNNIQQNKALKAAILSSTLGTMNIIVLSKILSQLKNGELNLSLLSYSLGKICGSYITIKLHNKNNNVRIVSK